MAMAISYEHLNCRRTSQMQMSPRSGMPLAYGAGAHGLEFRCRLMDSAGILESIPMPQRIDDDFESGKVLPAAWIIEKIAVEKRRPVVKYLNQGACCDVPLHDVFRDIGDAVPVHRRVDHGVGIVEGELTIYPDAQFLTFLLELPSIKATGGLVAHVDADMPDQILWVFRHAMRGEIGG